MISENQAITAAFANLWAQIERAEGDPIGRLQAAADEARLASDRLAMERLPRLRLVLLLQRSDEMLAELETLNLTSVRRVPESRLAELAALVAELPFGYQVPIRERPSPTAVMDVVFDVQAGLLRSITGTRSRMSEIPAR